jgi:hypothetical protein
MRTAAVIAAALMLAAPLYAQTPRATPAAPAAPPFTAKAAAPVDLTGYWVSVITEDWRWRMIMPAKGDYASVPITPEAKRVADAWDPAKDEAAGEQCRAYGAAGIMRMPTRLHITWLDENTLKVETDAGMQTRLLHFGPHKPGGRATWQGDSAAEWDSPRRTDGAAGESPLFGSLTVVTTNMRPGYLRKNGVPYSASAKLTEYWDVHKGRNGEQWLVVSTIVDDPKYLQVPWMTSPNFKREPDGSKWDPAPCTSRK